ncbi:MAG TPA: EAL domain-containing protein [Leucothrix mucor]|nr:EAL domain-containing protein [Leucothrix mucor]
MKQQELHCLVIRGQVGRYPALVQTLGKFSENIKVDLIDNDVIKVKQALMDDKLGLVFLFQESGLSIEALAELMRKNGSEAILVSLDEKRPQSALSVKAGYRGVQVCNLHYNPAGSMSHLALKFLSQYAFLKSEFRNCKSLLHVSEQRCHWLVDSSSEAVAYVTDDLHLYANETYINLFSHGSLHSLKLSAVSDLILEDEKEVFFDFIRQHEDRNVKASALVVTVHPLKGEDFRASIRLIPTVFCGTRCYQLWVRRLGSGNRRSILQNIDEQSFDASANIIPQKTKSPWGDTPQAKKVADPIIIKESRRDTGKKRAIRSRSFMPANTPTKSKRPSGYNTLLKRVLARHEVSLSISQLDNLHETDTRTRQYIVDLNVSELEYRNLVSKLPKKYHSIFWDQIMLILLFQRLRQTSSKQMKLIIPLSEASAKDDILINWLKASIFHLGNNVEGCTFLLSFKEGLAKNEKNIDSLKQVLDTYQCSIGADNLEINHHTKTLLKFVKPTFVRFSKKWVMANIKNKQQAKKLSNAIKTLEKNNIRVIAPYHSGRQMKRLFEVSGASFCQKQAVS